MNKKYLEAYPRLNAVLNAMAGACPLNPHDGVPSHYQQRASHWEAQLQSIPEEELFEVARRVVEGAAVPQLEDAAGVRRFGVVMFAIREDGSPWVPDIDAPFTHYGDAPKRVGGAPIVARTAFVAATARLVGPVSVLHRARVLENATLQDSARLSNQAHVSGAAVVRHYASVSGDAHVFGSAEISGVARIEGCAQVGGTAKIGGRAMIYGGVWDGSEGPITEGDWASPGVPNRPSGS